MQLSFGTYNILNTFLWREYRRDALLSCVRSCDVDVLGLQEVNFKARQAELVAHAMSMPGKQFVAINGAVPMPFQHPSVRSFRIDGNAVVVKKKAFVVEETSIVPLGKIRGMTRVLLRAEDGTRISFTTLHLHHVVKHPSVRLEQIKRAVAWLDDHNARDRVDFDIVTGDFNAAPAEPCYKFMAERFTSAHMARHGQEPEITWHEHTIGLEKFDHPAPFPDDGDAPKDETPYASEEGGMCLDYIFVRSISGASFNIKDCSLFGTSPVMGHFPSDHFGLKAKMEFKRKSKL